MTGQGLHGGGGGGERVEKNSMFTLYMTMCGIK